MQVKKQLNEIMTERGMTYNHNVQSVWLAEQLLFGRKDIKGNYYPGLNLTIDTLEGIWKHTDIEGQYDEYPNGLKKLKPYLSGSYEAQIVNLSDSIFLLLSRYL